MRPAESQIASHDAVSRPVTSLAAANDGTRVLARLEDGSVWTILTSPLRAEILDDGALLAATERRAPPSSSAPLAEAPADATDGDGFKVAVDASPNEKCIRCWHRRDDVGSVAEQILHLLVVFALQTIVLPLAFLWGLPRLVGAAFDRLR